jgi:hypothetical protein
MSRTEVIERLGKPHQREGRDGTMTILVWGDTQGNRMKYEQIQGIPEILTWMLISSCRRLLAGWDYGRFGPRSDFAKRQGCYGRFVSDAGESAGRVG